MASELALQAAARAWCEEETKHITMDTRLAIAFAEILDKAVEESSVDVIL